MVKKLFIIALISLVSGQTYDQYQAPYDTSTVDLDVFKWTNICRTDPAQIVTILQNRIQYFVGNLYSPPGGPAIMTNEGVTAVNAAITDFQASTAMTALLWDQYLGQIAMKMAVEQGQTTETGHTSPSGGIFSVRTSLCGSTGGGAAENISYGQTTGFDVVMQLIIDDGVPSRGHRTNVLNSSYRLMGSGTATNIQYNYETVINYSGTYTSDGSCTLKAGSATSTPGGVVANRVALDTDIIDVNELDGYFMSFWSNVLPVVLFENTFYAGNIAMIEYYTSFWKAWMYVFGFPIFLVIFWSWKWDLTDISYNQDLYNFGIEWMQDNYINNFEKMVEYHYMQYCSRQNGTDDENMFIKTIIMTMVFILDLSLLFSGIVSQTFGVFFNIYYLITEMVIQTSDKEKQNFFSFFDLEAQKGLLSATTYLYNKDQTWWNGGAGAIKS